MNKRLLKLVAAACSLTCLATVGFGVVSSLNDGSKNANAYEITLDGENELQSEYAYGHSLSVPMGTIEGVKTNRFVIVSPTDKVYNSVNLDLMEIGQYKIIWYANVGGKEVSVEKTFMVTQSAFSVEGGVEYQYMESLSKYTGKDGYKVSIEPESTFRYNKAIDLTDTSIPFAHVFPYQGIMNVETAATKEEYQFYEDARNYLFTLTDAYDPTNYVTIDLEWGENNGANRTYWNFRAGAVGQTAHGLRSKLTDDAYKVVIDGSEYQYHLAPGQGTTSCNVMDGYGLKLYYDTTTNRVNITFCRYASGKYTVNERALVADLSNETIYPDNAFKGFTTGEVYLSITAKNHLSSSANIEIASLGNASGKEIANLEKDTVKPVIQVNKDLYTKNSIAVNEEITIPTATALDLNLPLGTKASTAVYYAYDPNSENNAMIGLKNGKFTPTRLGTYTIVYTATDRSGNVATATVDLQCKNGMDGKAVKLSVDERIEAKAGETVQIPECMVDGLYADASAIKVYLRGENGERTLLKKNSLFLEGVKQYELTYVYETPFKTYTVTSVIDAVASDIISMDHVFMPEYFIKGASYTLDTIYAYEYVAVKPVAVKANAYMSEDGGEYVEVDMKSVAINANETVQFKFEYNGTVNFSEVIKVVDVNFKGALSMKDYFHEEGNVFTKSAASDGVKYISNGVATEATLKYVNVLSLPSFAIEFTLLSKEKNSETAQYTKPSAITFTFVDYYNRNNTLTLKFADSNGNTAVYIDGELVATLTRNILDVKTLATFSNGFTIGGNNYPWKGSFTSDKTFLWVTLEGMQGPTCLNVSKLCDNKLSDATKDKADPVIYVPSSNIGYQAINKVITIAQANASDIIAPYLESGLRLYVRKPDGTFVTSLDGVELNGTCPVDREYQIQLTEVGIYTVLYEYYDQNSDNCTFVYSPTVKDQTPPTLKVEGKTENEVVTAKWGATVEVASFTASDDVTTAEALDAWVVVIYPSGIMRDLGNGGSFYAEEKGVYTVLYSAYDEVGNFSTFAYVVKVA